MPPISYMQRKPSEETTHYRVNTFHYISFSKGGFTSKEEARKFGLSLGQPFTITISN